MNLNSLMSEIGQDADLLTRSDKWLEAERIRFSEELERISDGLRAVLLAQRIKKQLQQKNLVALQQIIRDSQDEVRHLIIRLLPLPDALSMLRGPEDTIDNINATAQLVGWESDGYDIKTSASLRR